jgi:type VII secretion protein EccCb
MELLATRQRSFPAAGVNSIEQFRRRKFAGEPGAVPDDPYGDVFLIVDDFKALTEETSSLRSREQIVAEISTLALQGRSYGIHVMVSVMGENNLPLTVRKGFGQRLELKLAQDIDATNVKAREAAKVPSGRPGRGMVAQNYPREGVEPVGLHTMIARPAMASTPAATFDSDSVVAAVGRLSGSGTDAPAVRRLPDTVDLAGLRAALPAATPMVWGVDEYATAVAFDGPHLMVTGLGKCGRTTLCRTVLAEVSRVYAPAADAAVPDPDDTREPAQVWLINPRRELLQELGADYLHRWATAPEQVKAVMAELVEVLAARTAPPDLSLQDSLAHRWTGPRIVLVIDDADRLGSGAFDSPLEARASNGMTTAQVVAMAADVGLQICYTRSFGAWGSGMRGDPVAAAMMQSSSPLLLMDANADPGYIIGRFRGHPLPPGRGQLIVSSSSARYVQVAAP